MHKYRVHVRSYISQYNLATVCGLTTSVYSGPWFYHLLELFITNTLSLFILSPISLHTDTHTKELHGNFIQRYSNSFSPCCNINITFSNVCSLLIISFTSSLILEITYFLF